jgi:hypothetical protein
MAVEPTPLSTTHEEGSEAEEEEEEEEEADKAAAAAAAEAKLAVDLAAELLASFTRSSAFETFTSRRESLRVNFSLVALFSASMAVVLFIKSSRRSESTF